MFQQKEFLTELQIFFSNSFVGGIGIPHFFLFFFFFEGPGSKAASLPLQLIINFQLFRVLQDPALFALIRSSS